MLSTLSRPTRLGVATLASIGAAVAFSTAASASTTIKYYNSGATSGGTSANVPANSLINGTLSGTATLIAVGGGDAGCTTGRIEGRVGSPNPSSTSVSIAPTGLSLSTCSDTIAAFNVTRADLSTPGTGSVNYVQSGAPQGTLNLSGPIIHVAITAGGQPGTCVLRPIGGTATGQLTNPTGTARTQTNGTVRFINVPVETTSAGICANVINSNTATKSRFTAAFHDLSLGAAAGGDAVFITP